MTPKRVSIFASLNKIVFVTLTLASDPRAARGENMELEDSIQKHWKGKRLVTGVNMGYRMALIASLAGSTLPAVC